jgi:hypothetical protein
VVSSPEKLARDNEARRLKRGTGPWACLICSVMQPYNPRGGNSPKICKECAPTDRWRAIAQRYGLSKLQWEAMFAEQNGLCALPSCSRPAFSVDHNHTTGKARRLLCQGCNAALGFVENPTWLAEALAYLKEFA